MLSPIFKVKVKGRHLPWINADLLGLFKQRDKAWKKYRSTKDEGDLVAYKKLRNICTTKTRNAKSSYYKDSLINDFKNPKQFWNTINSIMSKSSKDSTINLKLNNEIVNDPSTIANAFIQHFSTICSSHSFCPSYINVAPTNVNCSHSFSFRKISPLDVQQVIDGFNSSGGAGPDGLDIKFLKIASPILSHPLSDLFNMSIDTRDVPLSWKCSRITPLHKGGDSHDINNYRPISIINCVVKLFEKFVFNQLSHYIIEFDILSSYQSGFRPQFSTTTALLKVTNDIIS